MPGPARRSLAEELDFTTIEAIWRFSDQPPGYQEEHLGPRRHWRLPARPAPTVPKEPQREILMSRYRYAALLVAGLLVPFSAWTAAEPGKPPKPDAGRAGQDYASELPRIPPKSPAE